MRGRYVILLFFPLLVFAFYAHTVRAQTVQSGPTFTVNVTADEDDGNCTEEHCSIREAIDSANAYTASIPIVNVPANTYQITASLPDIENDMSIIGAGIGESILEANNNRLFGLETGRTLDDFVVDGFTVNNPDILFNIEGHIIDQTVRNLEVTGDVDAIYNTASGVYVDVTFDNLQINGVTGTSVSSLFQFNTLSNASITIQNSAITNSQAYRLFQSGYDTYISNTTISGNNFGTASSPYSIEFANGGEGVLILYHVTIADNTNFGFTIGSTTAVIIVDSSIFADNTVLGTPDDCELDLNSVYITEIIFSNSIVENNNCPPPIINPSEDPIQVDPLLLPLADNGGGTLTHALSENSPAIDLITAENCSSGLVFDQRGELRPIGDGCDAGAFESPYEASEILQEGPIFTVNVTADEDDGNCTEEHCSIREAIFAANEYTESIPAVTIPADTYEVLSTLPSLRNDMTISGENRDTTIINANDNTLFNIIAGDLLNELAIENLTFNNPETIMSNDGAGLITFSQIRVTGTVSGQFYTESFNPGSTGFEGLLIDDIVVTSDLPFFDVTHSLFLMQNSAITNSQIPLLVAFGSYSAPTFYNTTISGNTFNEGITVNVNETNDNFTTVIELATSTITNNENFTFRSTGEYDSEFAYLYSIVSGNTVDGSPVDCRLVNAGTGNTGLNTARSIIVNNDCPLIATSQMPISDDPLLEPLADNGGNTLTHALGENSPALGLVDDETCLDFDPFTDQRGVERPQGDGCDAGAFESSLDGSGIEVTPEITPEITPEVTPEITPEVTPEVTPEITLEVTPEVTPEITPEITETVTPEVTPEITPEITETVTPEVTPEITPEITPEVTPEITPEITETPEATEPPVITEEWRDADGDNYPDHADACPWQGNEGGLGVDETGCPYYDADWDGVTDRNDACPWQGDEGGLGVDETGCPYYDADWDGVTDRDDACPWQGDESGLGIDETGCPVTDVADSTDDWSDPDYDGDGFINSDDACPWQGNEGGLGVDETGCPYYDADWDGFTDRNDACPWQGDEGGLGVDETGCPYYDADWDGVYNRDDDCPSRGNEYGIGVSETGCPITPDTNSTEEPYATEEALQ